MVGLENMSCNAIETFKINFMAKHPRKFKDNS